MQGVTYAQEVARLQTDKVNRGINLKLKEMVFLTHSMMMERLAPWCGKNGVAFADVIGELDSRRDLMASYVHLKPEANRIVAGVLADQIWMRVHRSASD